MGAGKSALDIEYHGGDVEAGAWADFMREWMRDAYRVTKPSGRLAVNVPLDTSRPYPRPTYAETVLAGVEAGWEYRFTDDEKKDFADDCRENVWPQLYDLYGEDFLNELLADIKAIVRDRAEMVDIRVDLPAKIKMMMITAIITISRSVRQSRRAICR